MKHVVQFSRALFTVKMKGKKVKDQSKEAREQAKQAWEAKNKAKHEEELAKHGLKETNEGTEQEPFYVYSIDDEGKEGTNAKKRKSPSDEAEDVASTQQKKPRTEATASDELYEDSSTFHSYEPREGLYTLDQIQAVKSNPKGGLARQKIPTEEEFKLAFEQISFNMRYWTESWKPYHKEELSSAIVMD